MRCGEQGELTTIIQESDHYDQAVKSVATEKDFEYVRGKNVI